MSEPQQDCQALVDAMFPFIEQMLTKHGEFFPVGAAMRSDCQIALVAGYDGVEQPRSIDVIATIKSGFVEEARKGEYIATAIAFDARIKLPETGDTSDAITFSLNHQDDYSVLFYLPYQRGLGKLVYGNSFSEEGEADIFNAR